MKFFVIALVSLIPTLSSASVSDLEMGNYKLVSAEPFLGFESMFIGFDKSVVLTGKIGEEQIPDPGCVGRYEMDESKMNLEVLCQPNYMISGVIRLVFDLSKVEPQALYSSSGDGADLQLLMDGLEQPISFKIKYIYPE